MGCTFFTSFLCNSCNFQYFILGWTTLVLGPSNRVPVIAVLPFCFYAQGRVQVAVRAFDNDGGGLINMATFFNDIVISPVKKFSSPVVYTSSTPVPVNLTLSFRVMCTENFWPKLHHVLCSKERLQRSLQVQQ